ncbi:MAG: glycosyltransferase family 4 protein, partial [Desulfobacteraceae bacterium]|nr:glycosyltransferase family 4 protein [Desulfobacteraceae bacterium]
VSILKNQGVSLQLSVCGTGSAQSHIQSCSDRLGLNGNVRFKGFVKLHPDLGTLFSASDIFILPSLSEGVPKVVLEAMAKGTPVIATNVGGIPEIVTHKKNGLLVPPGDENALVKAIVHLLGNQELVSTMQKNAYALVKEKTMEHQAELLASIIDQTIAIEEQPENE